MVQVSWRPGPSATDPSEPWLYRIDEQSGLVEALLDPYCDPPPGAEALSMGAWRLARYHLKEHVLAAEPDEQAPDEISDETRLVLASVFGEQPESVTELTCEQALKLAGEHGEDWVTCRTELALRGLADTLRVDGRESTLVSLRELEQLRLREDRLRALFEDWAGCGGRFMYLRALVSAIDARRADLLDVMDEQPTSLPEWTNALRHRMVAHMADVAVEPDMPHEQSDELAWTAAMALEAAFTQAARNGDQTPIGRMLDDAAEQLMRALDHGHEGTLEWVECATHSMLDMPAKGRSKALREESLMRLLGVYAHLAGAIVQAGRTNCVRAEVEW